MAGSKKTAQQEAQVAMYLTYKVNLGDYSGVEIMGGLSLPLDQTGEVEYSEQLANLTKTVRSTLEPIVAEFESKRKPDQPKQRGGGWGRPASAAPRPAPAPAQMIPAQMAGAAAQAQGPVAQPTGNGYVVTVDVSNVYPGRLTRNGKNGPGTIIDASGTRYDTFDGGLLDLARNAQKQGKKINIMYVFNEQYKRNSIVEDGVSIFGEVSGDQY